LTGLGAIDLHPMRVETDTAININGLAPLQGVAVAALG
jgi:hypothetical protein